MREYDAMLIPGNGVREGGVLPSWVKRHLDRAVELYEGEYVIALSAGTTHRPPPLDASGFPIFESVAAAQYLMERGIPPDRILTETHSWDTIGNAYFSRVIHVEPRQMRRLLVIASDFHVARAEAVFRWVYGLGPPVVPYEFRFESVADPAMDAAVLQARVERERQRLGALANLTERITTMHDFHRWLFTEHDAYNAARRGFGAGQVTGPTIESY
ncbi:MAG: YdcF family protein [Bryobacteraceae bacterium]|jgi:uncharacterized SAM-binding protein YcdF (DUF218 family)